MENNDLSGKNSLDFLPSTHYSYIKWILQLTIFFVSLSTSAIVQAEDPNSLLSIKEIKELAPQIKAAEKSLLNIKIQSEAWIETKTNLSDPCEPWKRTPIYVSCTAWLDGRPRGKARVDVNKEVLEWRDGAAPYAESSYSVGFDGHYGRLAKHTFGHSGRTHHSKRGKLLADAPKGLRSGSARSFTGTGFSLNFFFSDMDYTFSDLFRWADDPNTLVTSSFQFTQEVFQGVQCIKIASKGTKRFQQSWWLDSERGFALLGDKYTSILEDGTERLVSFMKVSKLNEVADGIWWPMEAYAESGPSAPGKPYSRTVYRASNVVANDPNFDESVFTVPFPDGYLIDDKVNGRKYTVGQQ